ncbi:hypothetical protein PRIPAC_79562 [Pristionchus pacificus]|uniref:G protein-coupled receptor n=1 Tax=Pristionchus pacificus TaxID=54126 RepID=A0A2A6CPN5_PRIPA|nr:hypothetical protein PRIPAC_79562 [Pristionchus pacificus]|eukprot:PDM80027.1 G protein-coupled receptor [Pristionchus pacificus]
MLVGCREQTCASCGYPAAKKCVYQWSIKAIRRSTTGTGRMHHLKKIQHRFKSTLALRADTPPPRSVCTRGYPQTHHRNWSHASSKEDPAPLQIIGILNVHNEVRESISNGTFVAKNKTMPAAATPIPELITIKGQGKRSSEDWANEFQKLGWPSVKFTKAVVESIGHAAQMAWADTTEIGCGMTRCMGGKDVYVVCHYRNAGNVLTYNVYEPEVNIDVDPYKVFREITVYTGVFSGDLSQSSCHQAQIFCVYEITLYVEGRIVYVYIGACSLLNAQACHFFQCLLFQSTFYLAGSYEVFGNYTASALVMFGGYDDTILPRFAFVTLFITLTFGFAAIFILHRKLFACLRNLSSAADRSNHKMIYHSLTAQMMLPLAYNFGLGLWFVDALGIVHSRTLQRTVFTSTSIFPIVSPLINMYYIPPYRRYIKSLFAPPKRVLPSSSSEFTVSESRL